tara:strand:- start:90 stop:323 length:234 start_codon:yes stop_codon:yes gene_type:complete
MKGVKYNLKIKKSAKEFTVYEDLTMAEACSTLKTKLNELYGLDVKCNNQTIYNLQFRPKNVNRLLKSFITITQVGKV